MQKSHRFIFSALLLGALLLSACDGTTVQQVSHSQDSTGSQSTEVVFTGTVQSMDGTQWVINDQQVNLDDLTSVNDSIQVGDSVKVEANVAADGSVLALKIEASLPDSVDVNDSSSSSMDVTMTDSTPTSDSTSMDNGSTTTAPDATLVMTQEVYGVVDAISSSSVTVDGVTYSVADFTEFKDVIAVGNQVKLHVVANADGTFTISEIEKTTGTMIGDNSSSSSDDSSNEYLNSSSGDDNHSSSNSSSDHEDDNSGSDD